MSIPPKPPVFLERRGYRQRRMMDALRLLPVLGVLLWLLPLFWSLGGAEQDGATSVTMSAAVIYVFAVWGLLIAIAFVLRRILLETLEEHAAELDDTGVSEAR